MCYTYLAPVADVVVQIQTFPFLCKISEFRGGEQGRRWTTDWAADGNFKAKYLLDMFWVHTPCFLFLSLLHRAETLEEYEQNSELQKYQVIQGQVRAV